MSLIVFLGMLIYSIMIFKETVQREVYSVTSSVIKRDLFFENTTLTLTKENFDIAYMASGIKNKTIMNNIQEYISIYFQKSHYEYLVDPVEQEKEGNVYRFTYQPVISQRCKIDRFLNQTERNEILSIDTLYYCPEDNFKFDLSGTLSGDDARLITFQVEPCRQKILDLHYPGQNRKCKPQSAIMPYIKDLEITVGILTQYFN